MKKGKIGVVEIRREFKKGQKVRLKCKAKWTGQGWVFMPAVVIKHEKLKDYVLVEYIRRYVDGPVRFEMMVGYDDLITEEEYNEKITKGS